MKPFIRHTIITLVLFLLLTAEWWTASPSINQLTGGLPTEILSLIDDRGIQPWILIALTVYVMTFAVILIRSSAAPAERWRAILLILFQTCVLGNYLALRPMGQAARDVMVLSGACALGMGYSAWIALSSRPKTHWFLQLALPYIFLLALGSLLPEEGAKTYAYRTMERSTGIWKNPNTFGLLMGSGLILALGLIAQAALERLTATPEPETGMLKGRRWMILLVPAALLLAGLVHSLSRGAWLGTALAAGWLIHQFLQHFCPHQDSPPAPRSPGPCQWMVWLHRNQKLILLTLLAAGVLSFWALRHIEHPYIRRVFTVGNPVDFSWRNRVLSYEQALLMLGDRSLTGYGWATWQAIHAKFYQPLTQEDGAAITLNDYFILGNASGLASLLIFLLWIWLTLVSSPSKVNNFRHQILHAGTLLFCLGFWFDGGLFKLALAIPFWLFASLSNSSHKCEGRYQIKSFPEKSGI